MSNKYSFEYKIVEPAETHALQYNNHSICLAHKYSGEVAFQHSLLNNPLGVFIDCGIILLGKLSIEPPLHMHSIHSIGSIIGFTDDNRLSIAASNRSYSACIALTRTPVLCTITQTLFIVQV